MGTLDDMLRDMIRQAQKRFPDAGILFITVEDSEDDEEPSEITYMTNMGPEELADVASTIVEPEAAPIGTLFN